MHMVDMCIKNAIREVALTTRQEIMLQFSGLDYNMLINRETDEQFEYYRLQALFALFTNVHRNLTKLA